MKKLLFLIFLISCNPVKRLERNVKQVESLKQVLGIKPCICLELAKPSFEPGYPQFFPQLNVDTTIFLKGWYSFDSFDSVDVYGDTIRLKQYDIGWVVDSIGIGDCCITKYDTLDIH